MSVTTKTFILIRRQLYLDRIFPYIDKPFIKVITGLRRSGKSVILQQIKEEITNRGVSDSQIIYMNFESFQYAEITDAQKLYDYVRQQIRKGKRHYLFFDEIQEVDRWEKAVNAFRVDFDTDIYLTGSNSRLLSSELSTLLAGRYIQFEVFTLSFSEYLAFRRQYTGLASEDIYKEFNRYVRYGGFPVIHTADYTLDEAYRIIFDIYSSVILRDVVERYRIRHVELLERVVRFIFDNTGNTFSAKKIADYFKNQQRKTDVATIYNYLNALESAYIIHRVSRYDLIGKEILKTLEKYFVGDHGFIYALLGNKPHLISGVLENIIMLELKRRGYKVFTGKYRQKEIDFIGEKEGRKIYVQVAYKITEQKTYEREYRPLLQIRDNFPKYVLTMDEWPPANREGIIQMHIADFLLKKEIWPNINLFFVIQIWWSEGIKEWKNEQLRTKI